jgi:hypothetical protein
MRALAVLALLAAVSCTPDFASASDVTDLRVLAIQAEPPWAQFDLDAGTVDAVSVRVLAVDPRSDAGPASARLQICGPTDSRRCDQGPSLDVGPVPLAFTLPAFDPRLLLGNDKLGDYGGIRVQLSLTVGEASPGELHASKTVIYSPAGAPCAANSNPQLGAVRLTRLGADAGVLAPDPPLQIGTEYGLRPELLDGGGGQEEYCTFDLRGQRIELTEQARYAFFTGPGGEFDVDTADEPLDGGAPPDGLARFTPHADAGTIWIVVRDGRGGESWIESPWTAAAATSR